MKLESFENLETISLSEIVYDTIEPLSDHCDISEYDNSHIEGVEGFQSKLETSEFVTDLEMSEGIADYLEKMDEIKYENWSKLSLAQKENVLNRIEQHIAAIEHRPALNVKLEEMEPRALGYQCNSKNKIALNALYVGENSRNSHKVVIDTIIHEGRHAYQHYNVDVKCVHESLAEVATWRENFSKSEFQYYNSTGQKIMIPFKDGKSYDVDYRLYYYQPVEIDARNFAQDVMNRLSERGVV